MNLLHFDGIVIRLVQNNALASHVFCQHMVEISYSCGDSDWYGLYFAMFQLY